MTIVDEIPDVVAALRANFDAGLTRPLEWRARQLEGMIRLVDDHGERIARALADDLGKPVLEAKLAEISYTRGDAAHALKSLHSWAAPEATSSSLMTWPGASQIRRDPLGVVLIIAPWNYPFGLVTGPLIAALAAGNAAVVKPSEISSHTSALIAELFPQYLDRDAVRVIEGAIPETTALLEQRWDHIFYTGNGFVGRVVMRAAAEHLTPVTLELGGKSPCIVDGTGDLAQTARRICWGKFYNSGQTCVAPDYVLVAKDVHDELVERLTATVADFYGSDPQASADFGRIINTQHHQRLVGLLSSGTPACGGEHDEAERFIAPTVLVDVAPDAPVMQEEIFGPILPVLKVADVEEAIDFVNARPKPLALYLFSKNRDAQEAVLCRTSSGGATINHTWLHLANPALPFGGVGESGMGAYHGRHGFECFSHRKAVLRKATWIDPSLMYPPFTESKRKWLEKLL